MLSRHRVAAEFCVVDPDLLNPDPDTDSDPAFKVNSDPCGDFILRRHIWLFYGG